MGAPVSVSSQSNRPLRWLEWTPQDPRTLLGGIETHLLSMAECLRNRGVEVELSSDPRLLFAPEGFDVVRTHGDLLPKGYLWKARGARSGQAALRVHTLHGSTLGKALALGQGAKYTHWKAFYREFSGMARADLLASIHPNLSLVKWAQALRKANVIHWNGWDAQSPHSSEAAGSKVLGDPHAWVIAGRLWDKMKGTDRALRALEWDPALRLLSVPGEGMPDHPRIRRLGRVSPTELQEVLQGSRGLLLTSRYEGLSLVLLEALAAGVPVLATPVGGNPFVDQCVPKGLVWLKNPDSAAHFCADLRRAEREFPAAERAARAEWNRAHLWSWQQCTDRLLDKVLEMRAQG